MSESDLLPPYNWVKFQILGDDEPAPNARITFQWWRDKRDGYWECTACIPPDVTDGVLDFFPEAIITREFIAAFHWIHAGFEDGDYWPRYRQAQLLDQLERLVYRATDKEEIVSRLTNLERLITRGR